MFLFGLSFSLAHGAPGLAPPDEDGVRALARATEVWSFVVVHHPVLRSGEVDADEALVALAPRVLATPERVDALLQTWIDGLGVLPDAEPSERPGGLALAPDLRLLDEEGPLASTLERVWSARGATQAHVRATPVGAAHFDHLADERSPLDPSARLLAVARMWAAVQWWSPYRDLVQGDWREVLHTSLGEALEAPDEEAMAHVLFRMAHAVQDTHTRIRPDDHLPPTGACSVHANLRFLGDELVVSAAGEGLEAGDVVQAVDGVPVVEALERWAPLYGGSNEAARRRELARSWLVGPCDPASIEVVRDGVVRTVEAERTPGARAAVHDRPGPAFQVLDGDVAYLKLSEAEGGRVRRYVRRAERSAGWVLDLRGYPTDFVVHRLGARLVEQPTPFARFSTADLANPGAFALQAPEVLKPRGPHYDGPLAILVDESTQSSAEYHAMAFRTAPGARVFGSTTAGADGNVTRLRLPGGWTTRLTGIGVYDAAGGPTQQVGIVPDTWVVPTVEGVRAGRDEVLEAALVWLATLDGRG